MEMVYNVAQELAKTIVQILSLGYRKIDNKIMEKLEELLKKADAAGMKNGKRDMEKLIERIKMYKKENTHITNDDLGKIIMTITFYTENIIKYNDTSEL
jgi:U3 small nucleolar RNA-associated protein 14